MPYLLPCVRAANATTTATTIRVFILAGVSWSDTRATGAAGGRVAAPHRRLAPPRGPPPGASHLVQRPSHQLVRPFRPGKPTQNTAGTSAGCYEWSACVLCKHVHHILDASLHELRRACGCCCVMEVRLRRKALRGRDSDSGGYVLQCFVPSSGLFSIDTGDYMCTVVLVSACHWCTVRTRSYWDLQVFSWL
ncbi:hypothetical protein E2C01_086984 [Portunus trituberculatus]|uniref:Uncharacterized protein n=1 Tax=Portunus trituberculatus TaxID=210409 RepID=A0A5B7J5B1_PORTR|nr:hypothetical protein [Portunus trituberculatus]